MRSSPVVFLWLVAACGSSAPIDPDGSGSGAGDAAKNGPPNPESAVSGGASAEGAISPDCNELCDAPPAAVCSDVKILRGYASSGTCVNGKCTYGTTDTECTLAPENGDPVCVKDVCSFSCRVGYTKIGEACLKSDTWTTIAPPLSFRYKAAAVTGKDGRIYVVGGFNASGETASGEVYDPKRNTWSTIAPMPTARGSLGAALGPDGRVYAVGGFRNANIAVVEAYDPQTDRWASVKRLPRPLSDLFAAAGPDGKIYAAERTSSFVYDVATDSWTSFPAMPTPRALIQATTGRDGRIYVLGGSRAAFEAYDTTTKTWATLAPMPSAGFGAAVATSLDGRIFAFGGSASSKASLVYVPTTNAWSSRTSPTAARFEASAATGADGRIYVIGGDDGSGTPRRTAEAYVP